MVAPLRPSILLLLLSPASSTQEAQPTILVALASTSYFATSSYLWCSSVYLCMRCATHSCEHHSVFVANDGAHTLSVKSQKQRKRLLHWRGLVKKSATTIMHVSCGGAILDWQLLLVEKIPNVNVLGALTTRSMAIVFQQDHTLIILLEYRSGRTVTLSLHKVLLLTTATIATNKRVVLEKVI